MADIELVIKIPEAVYKNLKDPSIEMGYCATKVCDCVIKGTPLPKGHGRLKDIDKIQWYGCTSEFDCLYKDRLCKDCNRGECNKTQVDAIPTIIEADMLEGEE